MMETGFFRVCLSGSTDLSWPRVDFELDLNHGRVLTLCRLELSVRGIPLIPSRRRISIVGDAIFMSVRLCFGVCHLEWKCILAYSEQLTFRKINKCNRRFRKKKFLSYDLIKKSTFFEIMRHVCDSFMKEVLKFETFYFSWQVTFEVRNLSNFNIFPTPIYTYRYSSDLLIVSKKVSRNESDHNSFYQKVW